MPELASPFVHVQNVLSEVDVQVLKAACKKNLTEQGIPCYSMIDNLLSPTYLKIKQILEEHINETLYYLNDFYFFTDSSFRTGWHMDTELFTFESAINAWILLSPDEVDDPLGFMDNINDSPEHYYHSVKIEEDQCTFRQYRTRSQEVRSLKEVEAQQIHTPRIKVGDVLLLNPRRFHKTNVGTPKHCCSIKFVFEGKNGCLSGAQVPVLLWPEVGIFNKLVKHTSGWEEVITGIRQALKTDKGRKELSAGFYPDRFEFLREMVQLL